MFGERQAVADAHKAAAAAPRKVLNHQQYLNFRARRPHVQVFGLFFGVWFCNLQDNRENCQADGAARQDLAVKCARDTHAGAHMCRDTADHGRQRRRP